MAPFVQPEDEISKLDQLCGESLSSEQTDGPIEDLRRLDRIGPFCGAGERSALSVLSTFDHASMMSTGIAWTPQDVRLNSALPMESLIYLLRLSHSCCISSFYRCIYNISLITNCLRELPLATWGSSSERTSSATCDDFHCALQVASKSQASWAAFQSSASCSRANVHHDDRH